MQTISGCQNCSIFNSLRESENDAQEREKLQNIEYLHNKRSILGEKKKNIGQRLKIPNYCNLKP